MDLYEVVRDARGELDLGSRTFDGIPLPSPRTLQFYSFPFSLSPSPSLLSPLQLQRLHDPLCTSAYDSDFYPQERESGLIDASNLQRLSSAIPCCRSLIFRVPSLPEPFPSSPSSLPPPFLLPRPLYLPTQLIPYRYPLIRKGDYVRIRLSYFKDFRRKTQLKKYSYNKQ